MPNNKKISWHNERRIVNDLVPFSKNPRALSEKQVSDLTASIKKFDLADIPCIDTDNTIVSGHMRMRVLQLLGRGGEEIDVRVANRKLTKAEFEQYLLTANRVHGDWDYEMLAENFSRDMITVSGFDKEDYSILDNLLSTEDDNWDQDAEAKKVKEVTVKTGDLFQLGNHFIICGSNQDPEIVKRLMGDNRADMVTLDPPYNTKIDYDTGVGGKQSYGGKTDDAKPDAEYRKFLKDMIVNSISVSKDDAHYFVWQNETYLGMLQELYKELGIAEKRLCSWIKDCQNPTPSVGFSKVMEFCLYGVRNKPYLSNKVMNLNEILNKEMGTGNQLHDDILDTLSVWLSKRVPGNQYEHSTQKPVSLYEKSIRRCTKPGDIILELCGGSGTVLLAGHQLKRRVFLCEVEPVFVQLAIRRFEQASGIRVEKVYDR